MLTFIICIYKPDNSNYVSLSGVEDWQLIKSHTSSLDLDRNDKLSVTKTFYS